MISLLLNLFTFTFLSNFYILQISTESLHDFPWSVDKGNWIITAKLISSSDQVYDIREYVHSSEVVRGKITISSGADKLDIFYSSEFENDRLVIQNLQCTKFTFKNQWDNFLFNIDSKKPLLNHVLLTGPSILFRINGKSFNWRKGGDTNIRGFPVHSAKTTFNRNLDIIYYYKTHLDSPGILQASRLQFEGMDSSLQLVTFRENVNLDIYSITKTQEELDKFVTVTPGIGCPLHLITSKSHDWFQIPGMSWLVNYHFVATTTVYGPKKSKTLSEMFVNSEYLTTSLKTIEQGIITESLYDYNLGTVHVSLSKGRCLNSGVGPNSPGISDYGTFSAAGFLNYDYVYEYSYIGKVQIESGYETYVWERVDYDYKFEGEKYDKFVTSHYFVSSADAKLFKGFILVKTKTNNYKKVNNSTYQFIESITKDYYGLEAESEVELSLRFSDCYPDSTNRKTFEIYFTCKEAADLDCVKYAENHFNEFIANAKKALAGKNISSGRIVNIDLSFKDRDIIASVTFLKIPNIEDSVFKERIKLSKNTISSSSQVSAESVGECLHKQAGFYLAKEVIIFCDTEDTRPNICGRLQSAEKIVKENAGTICDVYYPVNSFFLFKKEIDLDKLEDHIRRQTLRIYFTGGVHTHTIVYEKTKVIDVTYELDKNRDSFVLVATDKKLIDSNGDVISAKDVSNLGDCYRTCAHDNVNLCETFVYCQYSDKPSCYTSNIIHANLSSRTTEDESCKIYSKNRLLDYIKISSREFKQSTSIAIDVPLDDCASMCSSSDECFSFQQCGGSCTLSGYYTDSISQESSNCDIYIPKVSELFKSTGRQIVSRVFHTEINLNLDQCAALCASWTNAGEFCVSFNYCPQNDEKSSCSLSGYTINDKSANPIDSGVCKNYQYKNQQLNERNNFKLTIGGTSGGATFGIIILFIAVGLLLGFIFPIFINRKLKEIITQKFVSISSSERETSSFEWTRQIDQTDNIQSL